MEEDLYFIPLSFQNTWIFSFPGDDGGGEDDDEEKLPSCGDYIMHFITLFWKLLFAFVPPTGEVTFSDNFPTQTAYYWPLVAQYEDK